MKSILHSLTIFFLFLRYGCSSDPAGPVSQGRLTMYLTDAPAQYDAVNIVVSLVDVHSAGGGWYTVNDSTRTFDLLHLRNGATAVLGDALLNPGHYTQIRLVLGQGSTVVVNGQTYNLDIPSTAIKLYHEFRIEPGTQYELLLDFDASRSIVNEAGMYRLKPTIRVEALSQTGSIAGVVLPAQAAALVTALSASAAATTYADTTGAFTLMGLAPDFYAVNIMETQGSYRDTLLTGIQVTAGQTTNLGTITLQP